MPGARAWSRWRYQRDFVAAALACFGYAHFTLYRKPGACEPGEACAIPAVRRRQRQIFWIVALAAATLMSFALYAPPFY